MATKGAAGGPKFVAMFGPVLKAVGDLGGSARPQEVYERVAEDLGLKPDAKADQTPSGVPRHENQMAWARFYLVRAGLLDSSKRGVWSLTARGRECTGLSHAQAQELFRQVRAEMPKRAQEPGKSGKANEGDELVAPDDDAPDPMPSDHRARVIEILQAIPPSGFERFCQRLLREAGFQNVVVTGRAGDGGIDGMGILRVNTLVSFKVLFQCKRYLGSVVPSQVRDFRGAMMGRADKGIILTTGGFTPEARKEAVRDGVPPIELVDGEKLVGLLEELGIGLLPVAAFRVDEPFFVSFSKVLGEAGVVAEG
ncbi:MAG: restriction endonuclease [Gemmatimonadaceae bacterium]|nr:restriction endonuclease [Gemmatimonadaceae bacterium]